MDHSIFFVAAFKEHFDVSFRFSFGQSIVQVVPSAPFPTFQVTVFALFTKLFTRPLVPETLPVHLASSQLILQSFIRLVLGQVRSVLPDDGPATGGLKVLEGETILVVICGENVPL